ncbi:MAG: hypothetical protein EPO31_10735 [Gammaproteobacteria bacterium]|nr:MAG: hypothetical protein EPO31_10735 [Gammaproteobacteria bacterium]
MPGSNRDEIIENAKLALRSPPNRYQELVEQIEQMRGTLKNLLNELGKSASGSIFECLDKMMANSCRPKIQYLDFNYRQVESLINQSADLLDRCLRDRSEINDLRARWISVLLETWQEVTEFRSLYERVQAEASRTLAIVNSSVNNAVSDNLNKVGDNFDMEISYWAEAKNRSQGGASYSAKASCVGAVIRKRDATAQEEVTTRQADDGYLDGHLTEIRLENILLKIHAKLLAVIQHDGSLNYKEQILNVEQRLCRDYSDALQRINKAHEGLQRILRYQEFGFSKLPTTLDSAVYWVREVIAWLVALSHREMQLTRVFSVRTLVQNWEESRQALKFEFPTQSDAHWGGRVPRLRGVSIVMVGENADVVWSGTLSPPAQGVYQGLRQSDLDITLSHDDLPKLTFGRIERRQSFRGVEILGQITWVNVSPLSVDKTHWVLTITPITAGAKVDDIDDIHIEFHYACISV